MDILTNRERTETQRSSQFIAFFFLCVFLMSAIDHNPRLYSAPDMFPHYRFDNMLINFENIQSQVDVKLKWIVRGHEIELSRSQRNRQDSVCCFPPTKWISHTRLWQRPVLEFVFILVATSAAPTNTTMDFLLSGQNLALHRPRS